MSARHLETWLARTRERDPDGVPMAAYIERELRRYLSCGILAHGLARARCGGCGHDFLVAFSCKGRGICPSCTTRCMAETVARLHPHCCVTDGVFSEAGGVLRFHPARVDEADVQAVQRAARVCQRAAGSVGAGRERGRR
jgi:hypothetical protein